MVFNIAGGGGTALNFKIVAYSTEEELLAVTPSENTIGIITEVPITSWIFSTTAPSPAVAGVVWISIGKSSPIEFNALKKNSLNVHPLSVKQYANGVWVDKTAKSYREGKWVDWFVYLFNNGDKHVDITGGLSSAGYTYYASSYAVKEPEFSNVIKFSTTSAGQVAVCGSQKKIDLTGYIKLCAKCESISNDSVLGLVVARDDRNVYTSYNTAVARIEDIGVTELDISNINGTHFIAVFVASSTALPSNSATISEIWLE